MYYFLSSSNKLVLISKFWADILISHSKIIYPFHSLNLVTLFPTITVRHFMNLFRIDRYLEFSASLRVHPQLLNDNNLLCFCITWSKTFISRTVVLKLLSLTKVKLKFNCFKYFLKNFILFLKLVLKF